MNYNKAIVIGNLTRDPELRTLPNGGTVCTFSIATNHAYTNKDTGQKVEQVEFHNIVVFGKMGETVARYMKKGSNMMVEGRLQTRSWEGKDGVKKQRTEIVADNIQFGPKPQNQTSAPRPQQEVAPSDDFEASLQVPTTGTASVEDIDVSDIPF